MALLSFYGVNILAGSLLVVLLGLLGTHAVARNQSLDVMLAGQEFQTAILLSALVINNFISEDHSHHGLHIETLMSLGFVAIFHTIFSRLLKNKNQYKVEAALVGIVFLMTLSQLVAALSPGIEFHMAKSFVGDIVTVSSSESIIVSIVAIFCIGTVCYLKESILKDSLEISLFNKRPLGRTIFYVYNILLLISMLFSIHLFGSLFTVGAILLPNFICTYMGINVRDIQLLNLLSWVCVPASFWLLNYNDRVPTTVMIIILLSLLSFVFCVVKKNFILK